MKQGIAAGISTRLQQLGNTEKARFLMRFFWTGPGQSAAGDLFIGVKVLEIRALLRKHCRVMQRTMLRCAIERYPEQNRKIYLYRERTAMDPAALAVNSPPTQNDGRQTA